MRNSKVTSRTASREERRQNIPAGTRVRVSHEGDRRTFRGVMLGRGDNGLAMVSYDTGDGWRLGSFIHVTPVREEQP